MEDFEYEVAFSFHQADEGLAHELNGLLSDRFNTFIYTERQKVLAGTDGQVTFNAVYGGKARVVVVFCRKEWGETPFTRIEMDAIKNRAFGKGFDFTLFIPTDDPPFTPEWLPRTQLWFGLKRFGLEAAAAVVEHKIQSAGGEVRVESIVERAARAKRAADLAADRKRFLHSDVGVNASQAAYDEFLQVLREHVEQIKDTLPIVFTERDRQMILHGLNGCAYIRYPNRYTNVLEGHPVLVDILDRPPRVHWLMSFEEPRTWANDKFQFSLLGPDRSGFYTVGNERREFSPVSLAQHVLGFYIDVSEKHAGS